MDNVNSSDFYSFISILYHTLQAGPVTADDKQSAKPSTVQTLPATQSRADSEMTTPAKDVGGKRKAMPV